MSRADELKGSGIKEILCVSVNDPFVMAAWGENQVRKIVTDRFLCQVIVASSVSLKALQFCNLFNSSISIVNGFVFIMDHV